ncbi:MAG: hypothetical protein L3J35_12250 [Bacteroidales bacterium]|nr:hypothetical protein [Bacteroidales bacterium]
MKYKSIILAFFSVFTAVLISCSSDNSDEIKNNKDSTTVKVINKPITKTDTLIKTDTVVKVTEKEEIIVSKYICPLGDKEGNSDKSGICPACEMELIENPDYLSNK